jgi:hypothetical protein
MFALWEINQMEQEMCSYLEWQLNVDPSMLLPKPRLDHFIAYALHRTRLYLSVMFAALYLLQHLKARFPTTKCSSRHRTLSLPSCLPIPCNPPSQGLLHHLYTQA